MSMNKQFLLILTCGLFLAGSLARAGGTALTVAVFDFESKDEGVRDLGQRSRRSSMPTFRPSPRSSRSNALNLRKC